MRPSKTFFGKSQQVNKHATNTTAWFICIGAAAFPFSVALANIVFAAVILLSLLSGQFKQGLQWLWQQHRHAMYAILAYLALVCIGLLWSIDPKAGLRVLSHQWMWLLLPPLVAALASKEELRRRFWLALSIGLSLHLVFCVVQMSGWGNLNIMGGSTPDDATGYIGHIGFGFVYGVWAGWLLHFAYISKTPWMRWTALALALWALWMIFAAQGRSGYVITLGILIFLVWTHFMKGRKVSTIAAVLLLSFGLFSTLLMLNLDHPRVKVTINSIQSLIHGDIQHTEERGRLWIDAVHIWQSHPILGVGTGGYSQATGVSLDNSAYDHPHQTYLLALLRWGPIGPIIVMALFFFLFRTQSGHQDQAAFRSNPYNISGKLVVIGLVIHGLSSNPLEEHATMMMAIFFLALSMADMKYPRLKSANHTTQTGL